MNKENIIDSMQHLQIQEPPILHISDLRIIKSYEIPIGSTYFQLLQGKTIPEPDINDRHYDILLSH